MTGPSAILRIHCPDQRGIVAAVTSFVHTHDGNVIDLQQHVDEESGVFFMRTVWDLDRFTLDLDAGRAAFDESIATPYGMTWSIERSDGRMRMAIFTSKLAHCLDDLLFRWSEAELDADVPLVISNHADAEAIVRGHGVAFAHLPITAATKAEQEAAQRTLLDEHAIDVVVLARYMQILSEDFVAAYAGRIINIHHSFLPAFPGARPYHSAHERGVKIIGATSHYVTAELDAGPIIEQDVARVTHRDSVDDLVRKGRDLERVVLAGAVRAHLERRTLVYGNKVVVFD